MDSTPLPGTWSLFTLFFKGTLLILSNSLCAFFYSSVQFRVFSAWRPQHSRCPLEFACAHKSCAMSCALQLHWINSGKKKNPVLKSTSLLIRGELWHWVREARLKGGDLDNASRLSRLFGLSLSEPALSVPSLLIFCLRRQEVLMSYFIARFEGSIPLLAISPLIFQIGLAQKEYSAGVSHVSGILSLL